jgi:hypothetical protein
MFEIEELKRQLEEAKEEIDCQGTDDIVCPYCGYSWENDGEDPSGENQCGECEKFFEVEANYDVTYYSRKLDCRNGSPHDWSLHNYTRDEGKVLWSCRVCAKHEYRPKDQA